MIGFYIAIPVTIAVVAYIFGFSVGKATVIAEKATKEKQAEDEAEKLSRLLKVPAEHALRVCELYDAMKACSKAATYAFWAYMAEAVPESVLNDCKVEFISHKPYLRVYPPKS